MLPLAVQAAHGGDREDLPRGAQPAGDPGESLAQHLLPGATSRSWCASSTWRGSTCGSAPSIRRSSRRRRSNCPTATTVCLEPVVRSKRRLGPEELRSLHHPAQQRPRGRHARHPRGPARAVPAAAAARGLVGAAARATTSTATRKWPSASASCWASTLADQPDAHALRRAGRRQAAQASTCLHQPRRCAADQDPHASTRNTASTRSRFVVVKAGQRHLRHGRA